ncbi:hypothetical protein F4680DRAFT_449761 [Xylaria scruposa]|nr:hypothetical protein F4680DRAFT_449761 [Xylaria scruposa]
MPRKYHTCPKRCSLPTIQEEPTPTPGLSRSSPGRIITDESSRNAMPTPVLIPRRNSSSVTTPVTSTWGTISPRSLIDDDECAILDDSDEELFGPPNSLEPLTFPRSPPKPPHSLSLLGLMLANVKELAKRPRYPSTPVEGAFSDSDSEATDYLEISSRGRRVRQRMCEPSRSGSRDNASDSHHPEGTGQGNSEAEERNVEVNEDMELDEDAIEIRDCLKRIKQSNQSNVTLKDGEANVKDDEVFWDGFMENHGGYNAQGW